MQTPNEHISLLTDLLPRYRSVNTLYREIVEKSVLSFDTQCNITDFYNEFNDIQLFEKAILNFILSADKEKQVSVIGNLRTEIVLNTDIYTANKDFFDKIDIIKVCANRYNPFKIEIEEQLKDTNKQWQELKELRYELESASWKNDKPRTQQLFKEETRLEDLYNTEKRKLDNLYQKQTEFNKQAFGYHKNPFKSIYELGCSFISLLDNYFPIERKKEVKTPKPAVQQCSYFDMQLISLIHNECNNIQFENLKDIDLYELLNLQPTHARLIVKSGEAIRMCFLISKLYDYLKTDNRTDWRTAILKAADIKEEYYKSKYKEPISEVPSRKSKEFAKRINQIFDSIS